MTAIQYSVNNGDPITSYFFDENITFSEEAESLISSYEIDAEGEPLNTPVQVISFGNEIIQCQSVHAGTEDLNLEESGVDNRALSEVEDNYEVDYEPPEAG